MKFQKKTLKKFNQVGRGRKNTNSKGKRVFTLVNVNGKNITNGGRFAAKTAKAAASKAFSRWCRQTKKKGDCTASLTVREVTRGNDPVSYTYNALRRKHEVEVKIGNQIIKRKYVNKLYTRKNQKRLSSPRRK